MVVRNLLSEIILYKLEISKKYYKKFLLFFKRIKEEKILYTLTYRIDEDRIWYYKEVNNKLMDDHLMKQNLSSAVKTFEGILERFRNFNTLIVKEENRCVIKIFSLKETNLDMYDYINRLSNSKETMYNEKRSSFPTSSFFTQDFD